MKGTKTSTVLTGGTDTISVVLYGLNKKHDKQAIQKFIQVDEVTEEGGQVGGKDTGIKVELDNIVLLTKHAEARTNTWKITVDRQHSDKVLDASFWPDWTYVKPYVHYRRDAAATANALTRNGGAQGP